MVYKQNKKNILITGGHAATMGIAVVEQLKKTYPDLQINFIGSKNAISGSSATTTEYKIYPSMGVKYFNIIAGKLQTKFTLYTIPLILMIPIGFIHALILLFKIKPNVIVSFGGFASLPVVIWGYILGIPIILHEQTVVFGRASKISSFFATKIALARTESLKYFNKNKCIVTGNPIMSGVLHLKPKLNISKKKTIFINVGSRGSEFIGDAVYKVLPYLLDKYRVIHIAGERNFDRYKGIVNDNYQLLPFVNPLEIAKFYEQSDIVIALAGASTISELILLKRPAIVIPLPRTFMDEQVKNAEYAKEFGVAKVIYENELSSELLMDSIKSLFDNWQNIVNNLSNKASPDIYASEKIVKLIVEYI